MQNNIIIKKDKDILLDNLIMEKDYHLNIEDKNKAHYNIKEKDYQIVMIIKKHHMIMIVNLTVIQLDLNLLLDKIIIVGYNKEAEGIL
jgi:hypothetical protein